ncbi:MAG: hypothetical protein Q8L59_01400 [Phenylobacterium sp.]|uniref:DUF6882 domain-containing protein n=1 Tax=Phenylobacterium sp. TaxID=1871053 RepID=UPI0027356853|nr:DUF6882 domain-containing protein [Phenylobacterium sp.]MDP1640816.1 hypothetical protein [Phenylobacterium sp.]MDP3118248.1 hypothetical protein [Phenylobacterium sp.]
MKAPNWYPAWRESALSDLVAQTEHLKEAYRWGSWERFDCDLSAGSLIMSDGGATRVVADVQVVGSVGPEDWLWSWANSSLDENGWRDLLQVRAFGLEHGIEDLTTESLVDEDLNGFGWYMTAVAARVLGCVGSYRPPTDHGGLFLICRSIGYVS